MRILIDIGHPANVHFFRNFAKAMEIKGHVILFTAREKDVALLLLKHYGFTFISFGSFNKGFIGKIFSLLKFDFLMLKTALKFKPDIFFSAGSLYTAHTSFILNKPNITVHNTDIDFQIKFNKPFTSFFLTPRAFKMNLGKKHIRFNGYQELAFLHPKRFKPNPKILQKLGVNEDEKYVLLRFVSWQAHDDFGKSGFSIEEIRNLVQVFSKYAKVFISSEYELPDDLQKYHLESNNMIKTGQIQDVEYYASLLYGESGAMAAECAVLGTPAFHISSKELGFLEELDKKYHLIFDRRNANGTLEQAIELIQSSKTKNKWQTRSKKMIDDNIDVTDFLTWFTENYPNSVQIMKKNPDFQNKFK